MADYIVKDTELTSVANAIRTASSTSGLLTFPNGFVNAINNISGGGGGENPNHVQVIPGTADNPWGDVDPGVLAEALKNNDATATMYVQNGVLGVDVTLSLDANRAPGYIHGYYGYINGDGAYGVYDGSWDLLKAGAGSHMFISGTNTGFVDGSQYMPMLNTRLTITWHPLP